MEQFLAKLGYTSCWAFGTPKYRLEENFDNYFKLGTFWFIVGIISIIILLGFSMFCIIYKLKENSYETK